MQDYREFLDEILVPEAQLSKRIAELGQEVSRDYLDDDLHLICILRGGVVFLTDLMRHITVPNTDTGRAGATGLTEDITANHGRSGIRFYCGNPKGPLSGPVGSASTERGKRCLRS